MFSHYTHFKDIEIELTSTCNSMCPHCARVVYDEKNNVLATNPNLPKSALFDINVIKNLASSDLITEDTLIRFSGAFSDPFMHPKLLEIIETLYEYLPHIQVRITTNGGSRSAEYIYKVSRALAKFGYWRSIIDYSIDGLEDTNGLYRYGVNYRHAYNNMLATIDAGCRVKWHCIEFPWNKHQLEEIEKHAKELGVEFELRRARAGDYDTMKQFIAVKEKRVTSKKSESAFNIPTKLGMNFYGEKQFDYIDSICLKNNTMFIGFDNRMYVCCSQFTDRFNEYNTVFQSHMDFDTDWNDLTKHNINDITNDSRWEQLYHSLTTKPYNYCVSMCGKCK